MSLSWNDDNIELMQDDCLQFLKIVFIDMYFHRLSKICTIILLMAYAPLTVFQFYYFFQSLDTALFVQYGPTSLIMAYACISAMIPLFNQELVDNAIAGIRRLSWSIKTGSEVTQKKIQQVALYGTYYAKLNIVLVLITYILLIVRHGKNKEWEIFYQVTFFKEYFPNYAHIFILIFYASILHFLLPMISVFYILVYFTLHLYFQSVLVLERIEKITNKFPEDIRLVDDKHYQHQVFHRLRFCVKRYADIKQYCVSSDLIGFNKDTYIFRFALLCVGKIPELIVMYMVLSFVLLFSYVSAWYLDPDKYYPLIIMLCIASGQVGLAVSEIGQLAEGENERLYETLISLPWYTFNPKNQKVFLLFIGYASKTISLCPYEAFPVNRRIIVQFYKVFSSVSALVANTRHNN